MMQEILGRAVETPEPRTTNSVDEELEGVVEETEAVYVGLLAFIKIEAMVAKGAVAKVVMAVCRRVGIW